LLAVVPTVLLVSILAGHLLTVPFEAALTAGAAIGTLALVDALFVHPPGRTGGR
jgi:hypothetical protein